MEFKKVKIGDICSNICSGGTPKSSNKEYYEGGRIPWLNTKEVNFNYIYDTERKITYEGLKNSAAKIIDENNVIVAMYGATAGRVAINKIKLSTNQACCNLKIKDNIANYQYVYYYLKMKSKELADLSNGGAQQNLNSLIIKDFTIFLPSMKYQNQVVKILFQIDKKIELNNKMNNKLYEIGTELLKNDFILESKREILLQVIKFVKGKRPNSISKNKQVGYDKYLTIACLNGQELNYADTTKMIKSNNDLLMVMDGASSGEVYYGGQGIVGSTLSRIDCIDNNYISEFIFFVLKYYKVLIQSKNTGSAIPHTDKGFVRSLKIPKLAKEQQEKYKILLSKIQHNQIENKTLEHLQDILLPKLMNGEVNPDKIKI